MQKSCDEQRPLTSDLAETQVEAQVTPMPNIPEFPVPSWFNLDFMKPVSLKGVDSLEIAISF